MKVVESKATLGLPLAVASPSLRREMAYGIAGVRAPCLGPVKEMLSESVERCGGWERENVPLCWYRSRFGTRKAGKKDR